MTMFDPRTKLSEQVVEEVRRFFGELVYDVIIPRTVRLSEAPGFGQPITVYDPKSKGAETYRELAREVALRPPPDAPMPVVRRSPDRRDAGCSSETTSRSPRSPTSSTEPPSRDRARTGAPNRRRSRTPAAAEPEPRRSRGAAEARPSDPQPPEPADRRSDREEASRRRAAPAPRSPGGNRPRPCR